MVNINCGQRKSIIIIFTKIIFAIELEFAKSVKFTACENFALYGRKRINRTYYESNFNNVLYRMRSNYALSSPNNETKEYYHDKIMEFIVNYPDIVEKLITSINVNDNEDQSYDVKCRVV